MSFACRWQDMKLNVRKWHQLECVGVTLADLASLLGARRYVEAYQQDLRTLQLPQAVKEADGAGMSQTLIQKTSAASS